jgi:hypothetical protein
MVLFAAGIPLISLGATFLLPESILIATIANAVYCIKIRPSRRTATVGRPTLPDTTLPGSSLTADS